MNAKGDANRSVRMTKQRLYQALITLLQQKSLREITVRELTELAGISRGTFYFHYADIYALMDQLEAAQLARLNDLMDSGVIPHAEYIVCIKTVADSMRQQPDKHSVGVFQRSRKLVFRGQPVAEIDHRKPLLRQTHTIILVTLLIAVAPTAAMHADNDGKHCIRIPWAVNVQQIPPRLRPVGDVVKSSDVDRSSASRIPLFIKAPKRRNIMRKIKLAKDISTFPFCAVPAVRFLSACRRDLCFLLAPCLYAYPSASANGARSASSSET